MREAGKQRGGHCELGGAEAEDGLAHDPETFRAQFQSDQEQQHYHAQGRDSGDLFDLVDQAQAEGADGDTGQQVTQHAAQAGAAGERHRDRGGGEQGDECGQHQ